MKKPTPSASPEEAAKNIGHCYECRRNHRAPHQPIDCLVHFGRCQCEQHLAFRLWYRATQNERRPIKQIFAPCPDCKGTGIYMGFKVVEPCRTCQK